MIRTVAGAKPAARFMSMHYCRNCGHPINLTQDEKDAIIGAVLGGERPVDVARRLKLSRNAVYRVTDAVRHPEEPGQGALFPSEVSE